MWVPLTEHLEHVAQHTAELSRVLDLPAEESEILTTAARWHDAGKAHPVRRTRGSE